MAFLVGRSQSILPSSMPKFEKPQKGNPHRLAVRQHVFPSKSIARFAGSDGRVHIHTRPDNLIRRAKPTDSIFCAQRAWDHGSEVGFKKLEDDFQRLAESILEGRVSSFGREQTHIISCFYGLWMARAEIRDEPQDAITAGAFCLVAKCQRTTKSDLRRVELLT
jgi:hypothetical protein